MRTRAALFAVTLAVLSADGNARAGRGNAGSASSIITLVDGATIKLGDHLDTAVVPLGAAKNMSILTKAAGDSATRVAVNCFFGLTDWSNYADDVVKAGRVAGTMSPPPEGSGFAALEIPGTIPIAGEMFACRLENYVYDPQNPAPGDVTVTIKLLLR